MSYLSEQSERLSEMHDMKVRDGAAFLWIVGGKTMGPAVIESEAGLNPETCHMMYNGVFLPTGKPVLISQFEHGRLLSDMEVLAWAAK